MDSKKSHIQKQNVLDQKMREREPIGTGEGEEWKTIYMSFMKEQVIYERV